MASRKKPTSRRVGRRREKATPTARLRLAPDQRLVPTLVRPRPARARASPAREVVAAVRTISAGRIKLHGVAIKKVLDNLSTVVGQVVQATQPPVALPPRLLGTLQEPDSSLGS